MDTQNRSLVRNFLLLTAQIILIFLCVADIWYFYTTNILPDKQIMQNYAKNNCLLANKELLTHGKVLPRYRADFQLTYKVDNKTYTQWVSGNGLDMSFSADRNAEASLLKEFIVGGVYPCWVDMSNPNKVVLVFRQNWQSVLHLFVPFIVIIILFYYVTRTIQRIVWRKK